ncbi:uncharacterized protein LOC132740649, partial [Ruditapes philippinarum]|uniref:uncharacterized protein LOC132740649 n=1 Tax=Ruditapes philippinarum TaxID=129788 RepID=UPI00295B806A
MYMMPESSGINFIKKLECLSVIAALILLTSINPLKDLCANVGPHNNETLNKVCDWSTWYPWHCECCSINQFQFRKRAICCEKTVKLPECLQKCNYSEKSDTSYKNCSTECTTNAGLKCQETAPLSLFASTSSPNVDIKRSSVTTASLVTDTKRNTSKIQLDQLNTETFNTSSNKGHRATTKYNPALNSSNDGSFEYVTNSHFAALPTTSHLLTNNTQSEYSNAAK